MSEFKPVEWPRFVELPGFARAWTALGLDDDDLLALEAAIVDGPVLPGTGGLRKVRIAPPPACRGEDVRRVRELMGDEPDETAFAAFLGAGRATVRSWEQGLRAPSPLACRLLPEIEADPAYWRKRLADWLGGPIVRGRLPQRTQTAGNVK